MRPLHELHCLGVPGFPEKEGINVSPLKGRHYLRCLQVLDLNLVHGQLVLLHIASEVVVPPGGPREANGLAKQILRLLDLLPRGDADLLPTCDSVRSYVQFPTFIPAGEPTELTG